MTVTLPRDVLCRYSRFSLYNSPYPAHDRGHAIDLYSEAGVGASPVAGVVRDTRTVRCPDRPYAVDRDHLIVVDVDDDWAATAGVESPLTARLLHVDPAVAPGDRVDVGDPLGATVRSGFFARWVDEHVHLGFRDGDANPYRASGSLRVTADVDVEPMPWDGTGTVVETGPDHVRLDAPSHPSPGTSFATIAGDGNVPLDGGLPHYAGGGALAETVGPVTLLGRQIGTSTGRDVTWDAVDVFANDRRIVGLSLFVTRAEGFGAKLVCPDHEFTVGDEVRVTVRESDDPIELSVG